MASDPLLRIDNILEAIGHIEADTASLDGKSFARNRRARQLVERNLEIISEASRHIPDDLKTKRDDVPWKEIAGIGNILRHDYARVVPSILWDVCRDRLPALKRAMIEMRQKLVP